MCHHLVASTLLHCIKVRPQLFKVGGIQNVGGVKYLLLDTSTKMFKKEVCPLYTIKLSVSN